MNREIIDSLLTGMLESGEGVSDLLFVAGKPPLVEYHGKLQDFPIDTPEGVMNSELIEQVATIVIDGNERLTSDLAKNGSCDCSYAIEGLARFRVNIFKQCGRFAIVMRKLASEIPTIEKLGLPPIFREMIKEKNGIIFVTGGTGSGKTTTLAAMLNELNRNNEIHILTLEDPIEFMHPHVKAAFSQRELGKDFFTFADGLRAALRQAPKVILVGEIRDRETMEIAMTASETGHVVFSTLHTINAGQTINRILGMFSREEEQQVARQLGIDGTMKSDNAETTEVGIFLNDAAVSKLEYYLSTSVSVSCDPAARTVTTSITMTNSVDRDDLSYYILALRSPRYGGERTSMLFDVLYFAPPGATIVGVDPGAGDASELDRTSSEDGRNAQSIAVMVDRGQTRTVTYTSQLPEGELGPISVRYTPTVTDTPVTIAPSCTELTGP